MKKDMNSKLLCSVYRSASREGMYLYVKTSEELSKVPDALMSLLGQPELVMKFVIVPEKSVARVTGQVVMDGIEEKGFYLQMPLIEDDDMADIAQKNSKLNKLA
ncbi:Protein YcgL [BD1-7 clade bacterium]|uniref:YcgL domain-containing protein DPBNPPHM_02919 n=1 Tax=BD1-7 clade bacterium TaxID=2029982 RepID=A0A5S9NSA2_9GAMM|nr:Protein YcgL [BD1-7 clade bacterium]CAA0093295.1 Protein YcgL [BD1-7 clade bacterium]